MTLGWNTSVGSYWSRDDDIAFETALAFYDDERKICWDSIAEVVPGKTTAHIIDHYNNLIRDVMDIESGRVPLPDYRVPEEPNPNARGKRKLKHKRQKGVSWTLDEHRQFLIGLAKYGKGDWRSISRNSVRTRTPTQVASHAQKYFERLNSKNKHRNRASIHDITVDEENRNISPKQGAIGTWQNGNVNLASASNNQAIQTNSQPSLDLPIHGRPNIGNTQALSSTSNNQAIQTTSQPSLDLPMHGRHNICNTQALSQPSLNLASSSNNQAIQTTSQPSLDLPRHGRHNLWNTQAISQPSLNLPTYGAPPIWNAQAALPPPPASIPVYGTTLSTMNQPMVGQMPSHFGTNMNHFAQPHMTPGVQPYPLPSYPGPRAPINMGSSIPYGDMTYANKSQR